MSQSIASSRNRNRAGVLARVLAALARLDDDPDSFGNCAECEEPIAAKRLELMPYVELCVECQQAKDGPRSQAGAATSGISGRSETFVEGAIRESEGLRRWAAVSRSVNGG